MSDEDFDLKRDVIDDTMARVCIKEIILKMFLIYHVQMNSPLRIIYRCVLLLGKRTAEY